MTLEDSRDYALQLDQDDPLKSYRNDFFIPQLHGKDAIYLTGNSLGLQPKSVKRYIDEELADWAQLGVEGHFNKAGRAWFHYHKFSKEALAEIMGAKPVEVVSMNSLTTNLHLMMASFYCPTGHRTKILIEAGAFPSDQYAVESQIKYHNLNYSTTLEELSPRTGEHTLRTEDIVDKINELGDSLALILLGGVQYFTGQRFDIKTITTAAHAVGAKAGFDLAHAAGNVDLHLHDHNVDFAVWCSYKYLNSGPGGVSGIFVHERYADSPDLPRLAGWWGHAEARRFKMEKGFVPMRGADGWQLSNVNVLSTAAHLASLEIFTKAGMPHLRNKGKQLSGYLHVLLSKIDREIVEVITPEDPEERGCQLSIMIKSKGKKLIDNLTAEGVVADWREPHRNGEHGVIRVAPVPLYNTFEDVYNFYTILKNTIVE